MFFLSLPEANFNTQLLDKIIITEENEKALKGHQMGFIF